MLLRQRGRTDALMLLRGVFTRRCDRRKVFRGPQSERNEGSARQFTEAAPVPHSSESHEPTRFVAGCRSDGGFRSRDS